MTKKADTPATGKTKDKLPSSSKRPTRKKPKDKPKRPLSAYNFFFKEEREKILKIVLAEDPKTVENDPESEDFINDEMMGRLKKDGGKVSFEEMGKLIGQRWKNIDPDRLSKYSELAAEDTERYKKEMQSYNGRQEAKMRSEALKPPAWNGGEGDSGPVGYGKPVPDARGLPGLPPGYNDAMAASFANQAAAAAMGGYAANPYAGMDLSGAYAMGGMYPGAYAGYGVGAMGHEAAAMGSAAPVAGYGRQNGGGAAQGMYAQQMMMGGAGGFPQAAGAMGGYGQVDPYGGQGSVGGPQQQYGIPNDQMGYTQGYGADHQAWGGQ